MDAVACGFLKHKTNIRKHIQQTSPSAWVVNLEIEERLTTSLDHSGSVGTCLLVQCTQLQHNNKLVVVELGLGR